MISFTRISVGEGAAVACAHCGAPTTGVYRTVDDISAEIAEASAVAGVRGALLDGPEPFSHPQLPALIRHAAVSGATHIGIATSAAALSHSENAQGSIAAGVRLIEVTLLGPDPSTHDVRAAAPGGFDAARAGVARFTSAAGAVGASVVVRGHVPVCAHTVDTLPATVTVFASWGASCVTLTSDAPCGRAALAQVRAACETGMVNGVWVSVRGIDAAVLGPDALHAHDPLSFESGGR